MLFREIKLKNPKFFCEIAQNKMEGGGQNLIKPVKPEKSQICMKNSDGSSVKGGLMKKLFGLADTLPLFVKYSFLALKNPFFSVQ